MFSDGMPNVSAELGMPDQHPVLSMDRHEVPGAAQVEQELQLFLTGMAGDMDSRDSLVNYLGSLPK